MLTTLPRFKAGDRVRIVQFVDDTASPRFFRRKGVVVKLNFGEFTGESMPVGQSFPGDPLYHVELTNGRKDGFWSEELMGENDENTVPMTVREILLHLGQPMRQYLRHILKSR
jgi:hypothetical protein